MYFTFCFRKLTHLLQNFNLLFSYFTYFVSNTALLLIFLAFIYFCFCYVGIYFSFELYYDGSCSFFCPINCIVFIQYLFVSIIYYVFLKKNVLQ